MADGNDAAAMKRRNGAFRRLHSGWRTVCESLAGSDQDYTEGPLNRAIILLAIPMMLEMLMESVFAIVDIFFVSRLGADALATLGVTEAVITLLYAVAIGLSMAVTALVARRIGEHNPEGAATVAGQALIIGAVLSILISAAGTVYAEKILRIMGASNGAIELHAGYTRIMFGGCGSILFLFLLNGVFRGAGDASIAMRVLWLANGINIVLDPCLIFGLGPFPELGLAGAALATTIGRSSAVVLQIYYLFFRNTRVPLRRRHIALRPAEIRHIIDVSIGGIMQYLIATSSWVLLMKLVAAYGSAAVAGYTIAIRIVDFFILPAWGLSNAAATLVGQNLGAGKPQRAEAFVWRVGSYNFCFMLSVGLVFILVPEPIVGLFTNDVTIEHYTVMCLSWLSYGLGFFAIGLVLHQAFNGAGDTMTPTKLNLLAFWIVQLPLAWLLAQWIVASPEGVFMACFVGESLMALFAFAVFRRGRWKLVVV